MKYLHQISRELILLFLRMKKKCKGHTKTMNYFNTIKTYYYNNEYG